MQLIRGREVADNILNNIKAKIEGAELKPTLAVILVGEDKASEIYVGLKDKAAREIGMNFRLYKYDSNTKEEVVLDKIMEINNDENVDGLIVQLPLPEKLNKHKIINTIANQKDVDGFCDDNQECFFDNRETLFPVFPKAIMKMVENALVDAGITCLTIAPIKVSEKYYFFSPFAVARQFKKIIFFRKQKHTIQACGVCDIKNKIEEKKALIVCKSDDFGKIMQKSFQKIKINANYFFCEDLNNQENLKILKEADIIVVACGKRNLINYHLVKDGAIIIDGGIVKENGKVYGDVDLESFRESNCLISPVPGGVGPVTVACLLENTYLVYLKSRNIGI
ncbi:MAG: bifunctional 5,10-methylenetetrahydrofolate dehydrogenase/5,10-methenyltetrahydrofolate cyclohydrolase [Candidatus Moraniibacteriota bacterium]